MLLDLVGLAISRDGVVLLTARVRILDYFIEPTLRSTSLSFNGRGVYVFGDGNWKVQSRLHSSGVVDISKNPSRVLKAIRKGTPQTHTHTHEHDSVVHIFKFRKVVQKLGLLLYWIHYMREPV